jgi:hypothetical protein
MAETTGPSWADIPLDLAGRILGRLLAHVDRLRFAAVCPEWRAAARQANVHPPMPLLLLPDATVYSAGFFLPTPGFLSPPSGTGVYRANSNFKPKSITTASSNGFERYTAV